MCHVLRAGAELKHGKNLCAGVDDEPEPEHLLRTPQPRAEFVQLEVWEPKMAEAAVVEGLSVLANTGQPGGDGRLPVAEDPLGGGRVQPFGQRSEHPCDLMGRGFQMVERGMASGTERGVAGRASKGLDPLGLAMLPISDESMNVSVCNPEVLTLVVGTSKALGIYAFGSTSPAFHLTPGAYWRRRRSYS